MSDANLIACNEDHELKYVLKKFNKNDSDENVKKLRAKCKEFKKDDDYKPHNRKNFYKYLDDKKVLVGLD